MTLEDLMTNGDLNTVLSHRRSDGITITLHYDHSDRMWVLMMDGIRVGFAAYPWVATKYFLQLANGERA